MRLSISDDPDEGKKYALLSPTRDPERDPILKGEEVKKSNPTVVSWVYCIIMAINGGTCGAFGPSLEALERTTGLNQVELGGAVLQNRVAKLLGTVVWGLYASRLQQQAELGQKVLMPPHLLLAASLLCTSISCAVIGVTTSGFMLQAMMLFSGFMYGITDSAANLMIMWVWEPGRWQRTYVAVLNAMFTAGALLTPIMVAASLHLLQGRVWPAFHALSLVSIVTAIALPLLHSPRCALPPTEPESHDVELTSPDATARPSDGGEAPRSPPSTASKSKATRGLVPVTEPGLCSCLTREVVVMGSICTLCFFANGCEHAVATWLSAYGVERRGASEETMAIMTSNFWTAMSAGRAGWACVSALVPSAWPVLFLNTGLCIASCFCIMVRSKTLLWLGAVGIGFGVSSSFPAAITCAAPRRASPPRPPPFSTLLLHAPSPRSSSSSSPVHPSLSSTLPHPPSRPSGHSYHAHSMGHSVSHGVTSETASTPPHPTLCRASPPCVPRL